MRKPASVQLHSIYSDTFLGVLQGTAIWPTPAIPTDVASGDQTIRLHLSKRPRVPGHLAYLQTHLIDYIVPASVELYSINSDTVLEVLHLMQLSFPQDNEQSISTLSRESMVRGLFILTFALKDLLQKLLLISLLHPNKLDILVHNV